MRRLTLGPAQHLGLTAGRCAPAAPADLVVFDPDAAWRIDTDEFRSKSKNAPFDGRPVQGRVERTIVDGRTIFRGGDEGCFGEIASPARMRLVDRRRLRGAQRTASAA